MRAHTLLPPLVLSLFAATPAPGAGDGSFRFPLKIAVDTPPVGAAAGDFNRDGKLDLAVVHGTSEITVLLQAPARRDLWTRGPALEAGQAGFHLRAADLDGDGAADLALADPATGVHFLRSLGDGSFERPKPLEGCTSARWLAVGDWNGDGRLDLLVGDFATQKPDLPEPTPEEKARHDELRAELRSLQEGFVGLVRKIHGPDRVRDKDALEKVRDELREAVERMNELRSEIPAESENHGWVWLFLRRPADAAEAATEGGSDGG
ncbi:MAG: FG-GAP repeat domain-containing protein, partial [Thermoanaerobaculia bacterium]